MGNKTILADNATLSVKVLLMIINAITRFLLKLLYNNTCSFSYLPCF